MIFTTFTPTPDAAEYGALPAVQAEPDPGDTPDVVAELIAGKVSGGPYALVVRNPMGFQRQGSWYGDFGDIRAKGSFQSYLDRWQENARLGGRFWTRVFDTLRDMGIAPSCIVDDLHYGNDRWGQHGLDFDEYWAITEAVGLRRTFADNNDERSAVLGSLRSMTHDFLRPVMVRHLYDNAGCPVLCYDAEWKPCGSGYSVVAFASRSGGDYLGWIRDRVGKVEELNRKGPVCLFVEYGDSVMHTAMTSAVIREAYHMLDGLVYFDGKSRFSPAIGEVIAEMQA